MKEITKKVKRAVAVRAIIKELEAQKGELEKILNEENEAYGNLSEGKRSSGNGVAMKESISSLEGVVYDLEDLITDLKEVSWII